MGEDNDGEWIEDPALRQLWTSAPHPTRTEGRLSPRMAFGWPALPARVQEGREDYEKNKNKHQPIKLKQSNPGQSSWSLHFSLILNRILYTFVT